MSRRIFCRCSCYMTKNYYIKEYDIHLSLESDLESLQEHLANLKSCYKPEEVIAKLQEERRRREHEEEDSRKRREQVKKMYIRRHSFLYTLERHFLDDRFLEMVEMARQEEASFSALKPFLTDHLQRVFSFPVFSKEFCQLFLEELTHFERSPVEKGRPNTMNQSGIRLEELGFTELINRLQWDYLSPITRILFPECGGDQLDSHKAFTVTYREGEDVDLGYHYDNAEVTLNVALNDDYTDGELYFGPMRQEQQESSRRTGYSHQLGYGVLHRGQQLHGALPISSGFRHNLIIWMRASNVRNKLCPMCDEAPSLVPVKDGYGDGFTMPPEDVCCLS